MSIHATRTHHVLSLYGRVVVGTHPSKVGQAGTARDEMWEEDFENDGWMREEGMDARNGIPREAFERSFCFHFFFVASFPFSLFLSCP